MTAKPERKPDVEEMLTADQLGKAIYEYLEKYRGLKVSSDVVGIRQFNDFNIETRSVTVSIFLSKGRS